MKALLKLFNTEDRAADGSIIPRSSVEEYLRSADYKKIIEGKLALGGVTHKDRRLRPEYEGTIGPTDQILVNDNVTHYFTKLFFKENDPFLYGEIELFNPEDFEGKRRENIVNLMGMLKSGVKMPVSIVIQALWSTSNTAEKIIRMKGVDFTNDPSFKGAGLVKIFSKGCNPEEKLFSNAEVLVVDNESTEVKEFSVLSAMDIQRMMDNKDLQPDLEFKRTVKALRQYIHPNMSLKKEAQLKQIIYYYVKTCINEHTKEIRQGKSLTMIYKLHQYNNDNLIKKADEFSRTYKQVCMVKEQLGFLPKNKYIMYKTVYNNLVEEIIRFIFNKE